MDPKRQSPHYERDVNDEAYMMSITQQGEVYRKDMVEAVADLPATGNVVNDHRKVREDGFVYKRDGASWEPITVPLAPTATTYPLPIGAGLAGGTTALDPVRLDTPSLPTNNAPDPATTYVGIVDSLGVEQKMLLSSLFVLIPNGLEYKGEIANANTDPAFPATPDIGDVWFITTTSGTVGGIEVEPGDQLIYGTSGWFVMQANNPILLSGNAAFVAAATGSLLIKNRIYAIIGAGFVEPAYVQSTGINTFINLGNSGVAEYDNTGNVTPDLTNISLAKRIRLITTGTSETLGNVANNIVGYGNIFEQIQNAPVLLGTEATPTFGVTYTVPVGTNKVMVRSLTTSWYQNMSVGPVTYFLDNGASEISIDTTATEVTVTVVSGGPGIDEISYYNMITQSSGLENHGTGMNIGTPIQFYNRSYDGRVSMNVKLYASAVPLIPGVDFNVITSGPYSGIDPLVSYPNDFIQTEYEYIPSTILNYNLTSVFEAKSIPAPDVLVGDFGKQRKLLSYSTNTGENDYIEVVRGPLYNNVTNVRIITDVLTDPSYRVGDVTFQVALTGDEFDNEINNGRIVDGRKYLINSPTATEYTQVTGLSDLLYRVELNLNGVPSGICYLDTATYVTNGILDIRTARYASTIVISSADPSIKRFTITGGIQGKIYDFKFEGSFGVHVFGANKVDTIAGSIILMDEDYRYILADTYRTESLKLEYSMAGYYQEVGKVSERKSLIKKSKVYDSDFLTMTADEFKVFSASIGTNSIVNSQTGQFGTLRSQTGASALGRAGRNGQTGIAFTVNDSLPIVFMSNIQITTLADGTQSFFTKSGFFDLVLNHVNSMVIRHDPTTGNWIIMTSVAGPLATVIDTGIPVSAGVKYNIMVIATSTEVMFMIGQAGGSYAYAGSITTNIPTTNFVYGQIIQKTLGNTAREMFTDYGAVYKYMNR